MASQGGQGEEPRLLCEGLHSKTRKLKDGDFVGILASIPFSEGNKNDFKRGKKKGILRKKQKLPITKFIKCNG